MKPPPRWRPTIHPGSIEAAKEITEGDPRPSSRRTTRADTRRTPRPDHTAGDTASDAAANQRAVKGPSQAPGSSTNDRVEPAPIPEAA